MNKLFSLVFGLILLTIIAEEVITSFDLIEYSESIQKEMESDESDSDEKEEEEIKFAKFFFEEEFNIKLHIESDCMQLKIKPTKSIGKLLSSLSNPPYSPPEIN